MSDATSERRGAARRASGAWWPRGRRLCFAELSDADLNDDGQLEALRLGHRWPSALVVSPVCVSRDLGTESTTSICLRRAASQRASLPLLPYCADVSGVLSSPMSVSRLHRPSYRDFLERQLLPNEPCIITGLADDWPALREWATPAGEADWAALAKLSGSLEVSAVDCSIPEASPQRETLGVLLAAWMRGERRACYVKDWHLALRVGQTFYTTPDMCACIFSRG